MNNKRTISALTRSCVSYVLVAGCFAVIGAHMCFVYLSGHNSNVAKQMEAEIYQMRSEVVRLSAAEPGAVDTRGAAVSHLVVVKPMTVSVSR